MKETRKKWNEALELLRDEVTETVIESWILPLKCVKYEKREKKLYLEAPSEYHASRIKDRYISLLKNTCNTVFGEEINIIITVKIEEEKSIKQKGLFTPSSKVVFDEEYYLDPKFNFGSFVVGKNNEFAYNAAYAVATNDEVTYNPLYIYGGSGLGKTHLMHAIGHYVLQNKDNKKVLYISSETFTNELIMAINTSTQDKFRNKYRNIDVLLIDDIQFMEGKEATQEEFFNTFETLYNHNKQIVISSDKAPSSLNNLDSRLTSRFSWSLTCDIQPPNFETRVAILRRCAEDANIELTEDVNSVINLIAEKIKFNVRELEGAFTRLTAFSSLMNKPINIHMAKENLRDIFSSPENKITIESIKRTVAKYYNVTLKDMDSSKRSRAIAYPRQIAMYLSKELTNNSLPAIGKAFAGRDHTTVLYAYNKIVDDLKVDESLEAQISELKGILSD